MKKNLILLFPFLFIACGTFNPGHVDYHSALTTPGSKSNDSVYVLVKQYSAQEAKLIFDTDFRFQSFEPIYISIFNQSNSIIKVEPQNLEGYISIDDVYRKTKNASFTYLLLWSAPWAINIALGWPIYYGIIWPVFGLIAMGKSNNANNKREGFYNSVSLKETELLNQQEIYGIVFLEKIKNGEIKIRILKGDNGIEFNFINKSEMFFNNK